MTEKIEEPTPPELRDSDLLILSAHHLTEAADLASRMRYGNEFWDHFNRASGLLQYLGRWIEYRDQAHEEE